MTVGHLLEAWAAAGRWWAAAREEDDEPPGPPDPLEDTLAELKADLVPAQAGFEAKVAAIGMQGKPDEETVELFNACKDLQTGINTCLHAKLRLSGGEERLDDMAACEAALDCTRASRARIERSGQALLERVAQLAPGREERYVRAEDAGGQDLAGCLYALRYAARRGKELEEEEARVKERTAELEGPENPALSGYDADMRAFYKRLSPEERRDVCRTEALVATVTGSAPLRYRVLTAALPDAVKSKALSRAEGDKEGACWAERLLRVPFGVLRPVAIHDPERLGQMLRDARSNLDAGIHGHADAKEHIVRALARWARNPGARGLVIGIQGPMGCGKTTLVKRCVADVLGLPLVTISLGGMSDGVVLNGHVHSYKNADHGRLAGALMRARCMNPVLLFDELDKVSATGKGQEVINTLIHLTDPATNAEFEDCYFDGVPLDFGRAVIVFTFNDEKLVSPVLLDRMVKVRTDGYAAADKRVIAARHLLPATCREYGFAEGEVSVTPEAVDEIVSRVPQEEGVRNLERGLHEIVSAVNLLRCMEPPPAAPRPPLAIDVALVREHVKPERACASPSTMYL